MAFVMIKKKTGGLYVQSKNAVGIFQLTVSPQQHATEQNCEDSELSPKQTPLGTALSVRLREIKRVKNSKEQFS